MATGRYDVTVDDDSKSTGRRESNLEDSCRKFAWKATEMSVCMLLLSNGSVVLVFCLSRIFALKNISVATVKLLQQSLCVI